MRSYEWVTGSAEAGGARRRRRTGAGNDAKVDEPPHLALQHEQHVAGLEVTVHLPLLVQNVQ